ncbi:hypothetical protein HNP84_001849 [Thermocatellispora tengchongensis]|uniref:Uncharacterized protein n=1 Tax=Thermocatellispora tengchongensis TaxID=1073253 RepID=A0A840P0Z3_9ACTN|nr:hypothetical protein [Thermocatellispora tengchongensis]MBB5132136.1 hypothetical protein [Thermocatellispora tengchongensis]
MTPGWPFLIARGRRLGYRALLAPEPMVADREYGVLTDAVRPQTARDRASVIEVTTPGGRAYTVAQVTHRVTAADAGEPEDPLDEHGRPLQLLYGFACPRTSSLEPAPEDLDAARSAALDAYRRFLADEEGFTLISGPAFPLRSPHSTPAAVPGPVGPVRVGPVPGGSVSSGRPAPEPAPPSPPRPIPRVFALLAGAVAVLLTLALVVRCGWDPGPEQPPRPECTAAPATPATSAAPVAPAKGEPPGPSASGTPCPSVTGG